MLKRIIITVIIAALILLTVGGCDSSRIYYDKLYTEYAYVSTDGLFVATGRTMELYSTDTFKLTLSDDIILMGNTEHIERERTLFLDCDENTAAVVKEVYREHLMAELNLPFDSEILDTLVNSLIVSEEMHYYKDYVFSTNFISAHRYIDTTWYPDGADYSQFEGVYSVNGYDGLMLLENGNIYVQDEENPEDNVFPTYKGYYTYANDFVTMTVLDGDGTEKAPQKYLAADLILPFDFSVDEDSITTDGEESEDWDAEFEDELEGLEGQTIKVLVVCFFVRGNLN